jgi:hypothetical protein
VAWKGEGRSEPTSVWSWEVMAGKLASHDFGDETNLGSFVYTAVYICIYA